MMDSSEEVKQEDVAKFIEDVMGSFERLFKTMEPYDKIEVFMKQNGRGVTIKKSRVEMIVVDY